MAIKSNMRQREENRGSREANVRETPPKRNFIRDAFLSINEFSADMLYKALWFVFLGIIYVFSQNQYDKLTYKINRAKIEMNEKRAVYISKKAAYMYSSKHSEISRKLEERGLDKNLMPPIKIVVTDED